MVTCAASKPKDGTRMKNKDHGNTAKQTVAVVEEKKENHWETRVFPENHDGKWTRQAMHAPPSW
jgi:hypothetical protein